MVSTFIKRHPEINWSEVIPIINVTPEIAEMYPLSIKLTNPLLTCEFIKKHKSRIRFNDLCMDSPIIEEILDANIFGKNPDWNIMSLNKHLAAAFVRKHWHNFYKGKTHCQFKIPMDLVRMYKDKLNWDSLLRGPTSPSWKMVVQNMHLLKNINNVLYSPNIPIQYIRENATFLNWTILSSNSALTLPLIREFINYINWEELLNNPNMTMEFAMEFKHKYKLCDLYMASFITKEFVLKYKKEIAWQFVFELHWITLDFLEENVSHIKCYLNQAQSHYITPGFLTQIEL
jgi:hypothetical protein